MLGQILPRTGKSRGWRLSKRNLTDFSVKLLVFNRKYVEPSRYPYNCQVEGKFSNLNSQISLLNHWVLTIMYPRTSQSSTFFSNRQVQFSNRNSASFKKTKSVGFNPVFQTTIQLCIGN